MYCKLVRLLLSALWGTPHHLLAHCLLDAFGQRMMDAVGQRMMMMMDAFGQRIRLPSAALLQQEQL
jgi:hypothetical protein